MTQRTFTPYRILIVDDSDDIRQALRWLIEEEADLRVVGEAADGVTAINQAITTNPELILLDIQLPKLDGITVARQIAILPSPPVVIVLSARGDPATRSLATMAGVQAFYAKGSSLAGLITLMRVHLRRRRPPPDEMP